MAPAKNFSKNIVSNINDHSPTQPSRFLYIHYPCSYKPQMVLLSLVVQDWIDLLTMEDVSWNLRSRTLIRYRRRGQN